MRVFVMLLRMLVYLLLAAVGLCAVMMLLRLLTGPSNIIPCHMYALYLRSSPATTTEGRPDTNKSKPHHRDQHTLRKKIESGAPF
jgi:hypothetical protein